MSIDATNGRFYEVRKGVFFPSSTTVLSAMPMNPWLKEYLQKNTKEETERLLNAAGLQGSKIHHTIDLILRGETISSTGMIEKQLLKTGLVADEDFGSKELLDYLKEPYTKKEDKMMKGFFNWFEEFKPETLESELSIHSNKERYAGTLDWLGYITIYNKKKKKDEKVLCVIDWKTGKGLYESYDYQVASYLKAYCEMHKSNKKVKKPKRAFLLQVGVNKCGYKFKEIKDINEKFKIFKHYKKTWEINNPKATPKEEYKFLAEYKL